MSSSSSAPALALPAGPASISCAQREVERQDRETRRQLKQLDEWLNELKQQAL